MTPPKWQKTTTPSVYIRHEKGCDAYAGGRCRCRPSYRGQVWNSDTQRADKQSPVVYNINEAIGWVADRKRGIENPEPATPAKSGGMTNDAFMAMFFKAMKSGDARAGKGRRYSDRTRKLYRADWNTHWSPHVGTQLIDNMDTTDWQRGLQLIAGVGPRNNKGKPTGASFSDHTLGCKLSVVRAAYRWGCHSSRRLLAANVTKELDVPAEDRKRRKRVVAPEDIPVMLAAIADLPTRLFWSFAFYAGMRRAEILALDWQDVTRAEIIVPESKTANGRERRIPVVPQLWEVVTEYRGSRLVIGPMFPGIRQGALRMSDQTIYDRTEKAWNAAGLPIYSPHEGRHTFASSVAARIGDPDGPSLPELQAWLGHASLEETAGYVQTLPGYRQETAGVRLAAVFG